MPRCRWLVPGVALAASLGLALGACADAGAQRSISLANAELLPDGRTLSVGVNSCNGEPTVEVEEAADEVHLSAEAFIPGGDDMDACMDAVTVELADQLGDRSVVDGFSGEVIVVKKLE